MRRNSVSRRHGGAGVAVLAAGLLLANNASALNFEFGDVEANINTLLTAGVAWRAENRNYDIISKRSHPTQHGLGAGDEVLCADPSTGGDPNQEGGATEDLLGGCVLSGKEHHDYVTSPGGFSQNEDQGNLNYDKGDIVHAALKATVDMDLTWGDFGLFARFIGFWDPTAEDYDERHFLMRSTKMHSRRVAKKLKMKSVLVPS